MLACRSTVTTTRSGGRPSLRPMASMIRRLAWCGTSQSTSRAAQAVGGQRLVHRFGQPGDGVAEHLAPVHHQMARACRGRPTAPSTYRMSPSVPWACRWVDRMPRSTVPLPSPARRNTAPGAVAEQHAGAAVLPVQDARIDLAADHQDAARLAGADHAVGDRQRVDEAGAGRRDVEAEAAASRPAPPGRAARWPGTPGRACWSPG